MTDQFGQQPGQQPPQTAGYGVSGQLSDDPPGYHPYPGRQPFDAPRPAGAHRRRRSPWWAAAAAVLVFAVGIGVGSAGRPAPRAIAAPAPAAVTRTVEVPGPTQTVVPAACTTALKLAEQGLRLSGSALTIVSGVFAALASGDTSTIGDASTQLQDVSDRLNRLSPGYRAAAAECRAAGQ